MRTTTGYWANVLAVLAASSISIGVAGADDGSIRVAFKYDYNRVIFVVGRRGPTMRSYGQNPLYLRDPQAQLSGLRLLETTPSNAADVESISSGVSAGDRFVLLTGRQKEIGVVVDRLIPGNLWCDGVAVALGTVERADRRAFSRTREKYYLVTPRSPGKPSDGRLGLDWSPLSATQDGMVRGTLAALFDEHLPSVIDETNDYARLVERGIRWPLRWLARNEALRERRGRLTYDAQRLTLGGDDPVLFVRARWLIGGATVFGLTAWVKADTGRPIEVHDQVARWLRMPVFQGRDLGEPYHGMVLNLFDHDRDGRGEALMYQRGYESASVVLLEYDGARMVPTGVELSYGC